jgi:hypothetical protein
MSQKPHGFANLWCHKPKASRLFRVNLRRKHLRQMSDPQQFLHPRCQVRELKDALPLLDGGRLETNQRSEARAVEMFYITKVDIEELGSVYESLLALRLRLEHVFQRVERVVALQGDGSEAAASWLMRFLPIRCPALAAIMLAGLASERALRRIRSSFRGKRQLSVSGHS